MGLKIFALGSFFLFFTHTTNAGSLLIDFEDLNEGEYSTGFSFSNGQLTAELTRFRADAQIRNISVSAGNRDLSKFGSRSLSSFNDENFLTDYALTFSRPVRSFSMDTGDFGADSPDILLLKAYSGANGGGTRVDLDSAKVRTGLRNQAFNSVSASVENEELFSSVTFSGGTEDFPHSLFYDNFFIEFPDFTGQTKVESSNKTIIGGFERAFRLDGFINDNASKRKAAEDCVADLSCTDVFQDDWREANMRGVAEVDSIAKSIAPLALKTSPVPDSSLDLIVNIEEHADEAIAGIGLLNRLFGRDDYEIDEVEIEGDESEFSINPDFSFFDFSVRAFISSDVVIDSLEVSRIFSTNTVKENRLGFGVFDVLDFGLEDTTGRKYIDLRYQQIESANFAVSISAVPLPASLVGFGAAICGLFAMGHRRSTS